MFWVTSFFSQILATALVLSLNCAPTFSLCSFLLTITAVICWSMNIRMVTSRAGSADARYTHQGFPPKGGTNQPLAGFVG